MLNPSKLNYHLQYTASDCLLSLSLSVCVYVCVYNGTAHLNITLKEAYRGQLWKDHQKNIFMTIKMSIQRFFIVWTASARFKNTFLFNETKVLVVNGLTWHYKLQHLFCCALYNQWKCKKRAVPLSLRQRHDFQTCLWLLKQVERWQVGQTSRRLLPSSEVTKRFRPRLKAEIS